MKITVTNDSPTNMLTVTRRADGIRTNDEPIAPLQTRSFAIEGPNSALSFTAGPTVKAVKERSGAPVDQGARDQGDGAAPQNNAGPPAAAAKPRSWNETRALARKLGAPQNVTKADAEKLVAAHEAAQANPAA